MDRDIIELYIVMTAEPDAEILGAYLDEDLAYEQAELHKAYVVESKVNVTTVRSAYRG